MPVGTGRDVSVDFQLKMSPPLSTDLDRLAEENIKDAVRSS